MGAGMNLVDMFAGIMADYRTAQGVEENNGERRGETSGIGPAGAGEQPDMETTVKDVTGAE